MATVSWPSVKCVVLILGVGASVSVAACGGSGTGPDPLAQPVALRPLAGDQQVRWPGAELVDDLIAGVVDSGGNPVLESGIRVTWTMVDGGGSIAPGADTTDAAGRVRARWTLGPSAGPNHLQLASAGLQPATFEARAAPPGPILFVAGGSNFYLMNPDGSDVMPLLLGAGVLSKPSWSPEGTRLAFVQSGTPSGSGQVFVMRADGSQVSQVTWFVPPDARGGVVSGPAWSPDGSRIAFEIKQGGAADCVLSDYNIYTMRPDGSDVVQLTTGCGGANSGAAWSPDGSKIAFSSRRDAPQDVSDTRDRDFEIYVMNADGTDQKRLTFDPTADTGPRWAPDGNSIFFLRYNTYRDPTGALWQMNPDGSSPREILTVPLGIEGYSIAPDGSRIALALWNSGGQGIHLLDLATLKLDTLTMNAAGSPAWRPK